MEIGLLLVVLVAVVAGEIFIYLKLTRVIEQISDIAMLRPAVEQIINMLSAQRSPNFSLPDKMLFQKEITVTPHEQVSRVDVKLSTVVPPLADSEKGNSIL
ncbi:MAG: hypothetical protein LLG02_07920 [Pelosinus sp.]|nr:hypothetical protein [Pelosinus sp.]